MHRVVSMFGRVWSQCSDRDAHVLGPYVATELGQSSVATYRPSRVHARSLCNDRAWLVRGPMAILDRWFWTIGV
ncbi:hypothetical protein F2Q68_00038874 [Brassica cretica]|uniref:Uncharacterized protein n=2 Tax=Brassica cretica TaxID=69181 RepID=A0A8S9MFA6_BRACR|nr:hypothetical protein F2Q68_00038874 [Brassica cretica]KAF3493967.1 hypothetical protein DY000_02052437 [Brassica cretica]